MTTIKIDEEIGYWGISASVINRQLNEASGDITVEISSPGGSVYEGIAIFNAIKAYDKGEVTTVIVSLAASMASIIALAGDTIKAYDNSLYMIHNASMWAGGDARELRKKADHLESITNMLAKNYVSKSGKSEKEITKLLDEETWFYGSEIMDAGFVDEIITSDAEIDSASAILLANESLKSCMAHYKENMKDDENEQIAALIDADEINSGENRHQALAKNQNKTEGSSMSKTYTEDEVQALNDNHAKALEAKDTDATALERKRVSGILALKGDEAVKSKAIEDGTSIGDTAIALNATQDAAISKMKDDFEEASAVLDDVDEGEVVDKSTEEAKLDEANKALENYGEKK